MAISPLKNNPIPNTTLPTVHSGLNQPDPNQTELSQISENLTKGVGFDPVKKKLTITDRDAFQKAINEASPYLIRQARTGEIAEDGGMEIPTTSEYAPKMLGASADSSASMHDHLFRGKNENSHFTNRAEGNEDPGAYDIILAKASSTEDLSLGSEFNIDELSILGGDLGDISIDGLAEDANNELMLLIIKAKVTHIQEFWTTIRNISKEAHNSHMNGINNLRLS